MEDENYPILPIEGQWRKCMKITQVAAVSFWMGTLLQRQCVTITRQKDAFSPPELSGTDTGRMRFNAGWKAIADIFEKFSWRGSSVL
jgi:hypothetical protein